MTEGDVKASEKKGNNKFEYDFMSNCKWQYSNCIRMMHKCLMDANKQQK